ncbi:MAG TPA: 50S ribosomal protein L15 [Leptospiraceae bacterium]|nr:50S ribosomal protein L15 [Leptospiraceae bacterium]
MKHIGNLSPASGSIGKKKRIGRGAGSGHGGTSTRGHKGHMATSGYESKRGFEGGQMPLSRRLPKFGFSNPFRVEYQVLNLGTIQELAAADKFQGSSVTPELLYEIGAISKRNVENPALFVPASSKAANMAAKNAVIPSRRKMMA